MANLKNNLSIKLNVHETEQESSYQNAALHGIGEHLAISIDVNPAIPEGLSSQEDIKDYLVLALSPLADKGWEVNVFLGLSRDEEERIQFMGVDEEGCLNGAPVPLKKGRYCDVDSDKFNLCCSCESELKKHDFGYATEDGMCSDCKSKDS